MRKVTQDAISAFLSGRKFNSKNTTVKVAGNKVVELRLHGNLIAEKVGKKLYICNCGWFTPTTKERLNALPGVSIQQKNYKWYLNGKEWDGSRTLVKP